MSDERRTSEAKHCGDLKCLSCNEEAEKAEARPAVAQPDAFVERHLYCSITTTEAGTRVIHKHDPDCPNKHESLDGSRLVAAQACPPDPYRVLFERLVPLAQEVCDARTATLELDSDAWHERFEAALVALAAFLRAMPEARSTSAKLVQVDRDVLLALLHELIAEGVPRAWVKTASKMVEFIEAPFDRAAEMADETARSSAAQSERWLAVCRHCSLRVDIPLSRHEPCSNGALHDWMRVKDEARSASPTPSVALRPHITACLDCISRDGRAWEPGAKMRGVACVGCGAGSWEREDVQRWTLADHGAARPTSAQSDSDAPKRCEKEALYCHFREKKLVESVERLKKRLDDTKAEQLRFAAYISSATFRWPKDHACAECVPCGEIVIQGFRCVPHAALALRGLGTDERLPPEAYETPPDPPDPYIGKVCETEDGTERIRVFGCYGIGSGGLLYGVSFPNALDFKSPNGMSASEIASKYPRIVDAVRPEQARRKEGE